MTDLETWKREARASLTWASTGGDLRREDLIMQALAHVERLKASAVKWVPVSERLPEKVEREYLTSNGYSVTIMRFTANNLFSYEPFPIGPAQIIAWSELPAPYEGER